MAPMYVYPAPGVMPFGHMMVVATRTVDVMTVTCLSIRQVMSGLISSIFPRESYSITESKVLYILFRNTELAQLLESSFQDSYSKISTSKMSMISE